MKKTLLTIPCFLLLLAGCQEAKNKAATSVFEKSVEAVSGKKIDMADVDNIENNHAIVDVVLASENLQPLFKKSFGSITASKETISITIASGETGQDNILLGFTGKDLTTSRPISGKKKSEDGNEFTFSMMKVTEQGAETLISFDAEGEIISIRKNKIIIKVKGNLSSTLDANNPEKWKKYEGTITLNYPVFQAIGSSKEEFIY